MKSVSFEVNYIPPWKQVPADAAEAAHQADRTEALKVKAREVFTGPPITTACAMSIRYSRSKGRADSAGIIGGIADGLQKIVFKNDKQLHEICYKEWKGDKDWYQVTVTELKYE